MIGASRIRLTNNPQNKLTEKMMSTQTAGTEALKSIKERSDIAFSGKTKKVQIKLAVITRQEYCEEVDVPIEFDSSDLNDLANETYSVCDGSEFSEDQEYWEKGDCSVDPIN